VKMGKNIYAAAKKLEKSQTVLTGIKRNYTPNAPDLGEGRGPQWQGMHVTKSATVRGGRLPAGLAPKLHERHATDVFAGMVRVRHTYQKATQTQFMTWRMISTKNPKGWMHPGIQAHNLAEKVAAHIQTQAPKLIARMVKAMERGI